MKIFISGLGILLHILGTYTLIVPDEIPSLLSIIYSNIPTIKKGTDSRLGWGFRLGDRADFQVLVELGPQTYTQPLGNQEDKGNTNKRNTLNNLSNTLYAKRQEEKKQISKTEGGKWIDNWSKEMNSQKEPAVVEPQMIPKNARPGLAIGEIDAKSVIPEDSALAMEELHDNKPVTSRTLALKVVTPGKAN